MFALWVEVHCCRIIDRFTALLRHLEAVCNLSRSFFELGVWRTWRGKKKTCHCGMVCRTTDVMCHVLAYVTMYTTTVLSLPQFAWFASPLHVPASTRAVVGCVAAT